MSACCAPLASSSLCSPFCVKPLAWLACACRHQPPASGRAERRSQLRWVVALAVQCSQAGRNRAPEPWEKSADQLQQPARIRSLRQVTYGRLLPLSSGRFGADERGEEEGGHCTIEFAARSQQRRKMIQFFPHYQPSPANLWSEAELSLGLSTGGATLSGDSSLLSSLQPPRPLGGSAMECLARVRPHNGRHKRSEARLIVCSPRDCRANFDLPSLAAYI